VKGLKKGWRGAEAVDWHPTRGGHKGKGVAPLLGSHGQAGDGRGRPAGARGR
jgi:hypothetical protein